MRIWTSNTKIPMTADGILDYSLDFTKWLEGGTLASAVPTPNGCTAGVPTITGNVVKVRVSQLTVDIASVALRVGTADGQFDTFTLWFDATPQ